MEHYVNLYEVEIDRRKGTGRHVYYLLVLAVDDQTVAEIVASSVSCIHGYKFTMVAERVAMTTSVYRVIAQYDASIYFRTNTRY